MTAPQQTTITQQPDASATPGKRSLRGKATILSLGLVTAALIAAVPLSATAPNAASGARDGPQPGSDPALPRVNGAAGRLGRARAAPEGMNVEALSAVVAKKYRVSYEATRSMIDLAYREAGQNGLDPMLVVAVMAVESRFNPIAQSESGAMGLMQVIPRFHPDKFADDGKKSIFDPHVNIELGAKVLKEYIRRGGTEVAGLQLYNGASNDPTYAYADKVMAEKQRLHEALRRARNRA
jgi:soluble lytic murein transglycosylase-like protein